MIKKSTTDVQKFDRISEFKYDSENKFYTQKNFNKTSNNKSNYYYYSCKQDQITNFKKNNYNNVNIKFKIFFQKQNIKSQVPEDLINFENCQLNPKENKIINLPKSDFQNNYSNKYNDIYQEEQIFQNYNFQNNPYTTQNNSIKNNLLKNSKNSSEKFNDFEESYFSQNENYLNLNSNKINYFPTNKINEKSKNLEAEKFNFQTQNDLRDFKSINEVFENPDKLRNNLNKKVKNKFLTINNFKYNSDFNKNKENFITIEEGNFSEKNILDDTNTKENTNANTTCSESPIFNKNKKSFDLKSNKIHIETEFKELKNINYDNITILKDLQENVNKKDRRENIFENIEKKEEFISTEIPKRNIQETNINKKIIQENSTKKLLIKFDLNSITNNNDNNNTLLYSQNDP